MADTTIANLLVIATLLPLAGFALVILFGSPFKDPDKPAWFTVGVMGIALACSIAALVAFMQRAPVEIQGARQAITVVYNWFPIGHFADGSMRYLQVGPYVDEVTVTLMAMVCLISMVVHVYSIGYMEDH